MRELIQTGMHSVNQISLSSSIGKALFKINNKGKLIYLLMIQHLKLVTCYNKL